MPPKQKQKAPPRAGQQKGNSHKTSVQISTAAPESTVRRSARIRGQVKAQESSIDKPTTTENPGETTKQTRKPRGKPRKSESGKNDRSVIREVDTPRGRDSATAPNTQEQNQTTTGRTPRTIQQTVEETDAPRVSQGVIDKSLQNLQPYSRLDSWLEEVRASPSVDIDPFFSDWRKFDSSDMTRSITYSAESLATSEIQSTVRPNKRGKKKVQLEEGLRTRLVEFEERIEDPMAATLKSNIVSDAPPILLEQTNSLRNKMKLFLSKTDELQRDVSIYNIVEELSDAINEWKSTVHMATISNREFDMDLKRCQHPANEAVLQRTVMMSIFNRHQISDKFDYNCEGQWSLQNNYYALPSTEENSITAPKPDLAIFFRFDSLLGGGTYSKSTPIPDSLKACMSPDGSIHRCFPFIFIEAKKGTDGVGPALMANMHSASQALFNIYVWMSEAGQQEKFFSDVRLFSLVINAEHFRLRVHRARVVEGKGNRLEFCYDDICKMVEYKRDNVYNLIRNVLIEYAEKTLLDILKQSVLAVSQNPRQALKRKSEVAGLATGDPLSKRTTVAPSNQVVDPSASFGMNLEMSQVAI